MMQSWFSPMLIRIIEIPMFCLNLIRIDHCQGPNLANPASYVAPCRGKLRHCSSAFATTNSEFEATKERRHDQAGTVREYITIHYILTNEWRQSDITKKTNRFFQISEVCESWILGCLILCSMYLNFSYGRLNAVEEQGWDG